jgi:hypothetical protein
MAAVSVFVDDAVRGRLPPVCVKTGEPTDFVVLTRQEVGRSAGLAWLLVFLGPPGWIALVLVTMMGSNSEYLTVRLPQTPAARNRENLLERRRLAAIAGLCIPMLGLVRPGPFPLLWWALLAAVFATVVALQVLITRQRIGIFLDASRRWVTLTRVHPDFVRAVDREEALPGSAR